MKWKLLTALLGLFLVHAALATIPLYQNLDVLQYTIPGTPPPQIDARAFDNENTFSINFETFNPGTPYYETLNTMFYTNTGTIIANSPVSSVVSLTVLSLGYQSFGCGYNFDLQNANHLWADTFYNPGTIRSASTIDGNGLVFGGSIFGTQFAQLTQLTSYGQIQISATNIINPGTVDVSVNGLINLTGRNVDLTGAQLIVEPPLNPFGLSSVGINSIGATGIDTNGDWNAGLDLGPTAATSSDVPIPPFQLVLTNSQCYHDVRQPAGTVDYNIFRYVFVENNSPNIPYNVYIDNPDTVSLGFAGGAAHVEWVASYTDPASGNPVNNYLYLTDDYALGASTNNYVLNGVPVNFTFQTSPVQLLFGPKSTNFMALPDLFQSNNYACFFGSLTAATVGTNVSATNPHGTITNLPGKVNISASNELNLAFATITGPNYLSLNCTNQFDGSPGAAVTAPYSDIALGVTNGFLTFSNVLVANIPGLSGPIQAWSSDWISVDTTVTPNVTNEYKVMIVFSQLQPTTVPWIQNLYLHGTNQLVVSDHLNVYNSFYADARSLTLNTNQVGVGATSLDGELTWLNPTPFNANSGSGVQQMPNLLWVTNNGAIRVLDNATFGNPKVPQFVVTPGVPAVAANGILSETGSNAVQTDQVTIGTNQYVFVGVITNKAANQIKIGTTFDASMSNLIAAINHSTGSGTTYSTNTRANPKASAGALKNHAFTVTAITAGSAGNIIPTLFTPATAAVNLTWSNPTLTNGADAVPPSTNYTSFNNHSMIADQGTAIWTTYFENDGTISNGTGSFTLQSSMAVLTNGNLVANADVVLVATNVPGFGMNGIIISNQMIQAGHKLTLWATNITDTGVTNGNIWVVGTNALGGAVGGSSDSGFNIPIKPPMGDLLGTTVTNVAPTGKTVYNVWAGHDYGLSNRGFSNNIALGKLVFDSFGPDSKVSFVYNGASTSNAIYVDCLILEDNSTHGNATNSYNFPWLQINTNMMIYYAQALESGASVAEQIDKASLHGGNSGGRLRWIYSYAGYFSSTNLIYTSMDGTTFTNTVNAALAQSSDIDSDSDGLPNNVDPTPFFLPTNLNFTVTMTNLPPKSAKVQWTTIPNATNFIYYTTNLLATNNWLAFTNFKNWYYGNNVAVTNSAHVNYFRSPQTYVNNASLPDNSQETNVWVFDAITNVPHYYKVVVWPWLNFGE
jgi:hypothetical protein